MVSCRDACCKAGPLHIILRLQEEIIHEAQTMKSYHHKNVLPLYTSFVHGQDLWMVTPFMSGGSVLHIMKYQYPDVSPAGSAYSRSQPQQWPPQPLRSLVCCWHSWQQQPDNAGLALGSGARASLCCWLAAGPCL